MRFFLANAFKTFFFAAFAFVFFFAFTFAFAFAFAFAFTVAFTFAFVFAFAFTLAWAAGFNRLTSVIATDTTENPAEEFANSWTFMTHLSYLLT